MKNYRHCLNPSKKWGGLQLIKPMDQPSTKNGSYQAINKAKKIFQT
jgi:hypothetical protein